MVLSTDQWNAFNELGAGFFSALNVLALYRSKAVTGVHWAAWGFYCYWGIANLIVYPDNGMIWSFWAGIPVVVFNTIWLWLVFWYRRQDQIHFQEIAGVHWSYE